MKQRGLSGIRTAEQVNSWQLPSIESTPGVGSSEETAPSAPPTAAEIEAIQRQARQEGFDQGLEEGTNQGYQSGLASGQEVIEGLSTLLDALAKPVRLLSDQIMDELVAVIRAVARQLVRREIHQDPGQLIAVIREAVNALPFSSQHIQIRLHPEDSARVREVLALDSKAPIWELVDDLALNRGDVRLIGDASQVDGRLETRLNALVAGMLGGVRQADEMVADPASDSAVADLSDHESVSSD